MDNKNFRDAFDPVRPSEEVKRNVLNMAADREKQPGKLRRAAIRVAAVAAALAIFVTAMLWPRKTEDGIVTAPGVLKAYAYEMKGESNIDLTEMEDYELVAGPEFSSKTVWCPYANSTSGIAVTLVISEESLQDAQITFDIKINYGELYGDFYSDRYLNGGDMLTSHRNASMGKSGTANNGETVYWEGYELWSALAEYASMAELLADTGKIYMDVLIKADDNIIGYAVFEMVSLEDAGCIFGVSLRNTVYYPPVDGEFQNVTADYVWQKIDESKLG